MDHRILALLIVLAFCLSSISITSPYLLLITILLGITSCVLFLLKRYHKKHTLVEKRYLFLLTTLIMLVATTGWSISPFFALLYASGLVLTIYGEKTAALWFFIALTVVGIFSIGSVDLLYDVLMVSSNLVGMVLVFIISRYLKVHPSRSR